MNPWMWAGIMPEDQAKIMTGALGTAEELRRTKEMPEISRLRGAQATHLEAEASKLGWQRPQPYKLADGTTVMMAPEKIAEYNIHNTANAINMAHVGVMQQAEQLKRDALWADKYGTTSESAARWAKVREAETSADALRNFKPDPNDPAGTTLGLLKIHPEAAGMYIKGLVDEDSQLKAKSLEGFYRDQQKLAQDRLNNLIYANGTINGKKISEMTEEEIRAWIHQQAYSATEQFYDMTTGKRRKEIAPPARMGGGGTGTGTKSPADFPYGRIQ